MPLDLNEIVGAVAWLMRSNTIMRNVSMSLELSPDLPNARGDRVQLQQVVLNLVLNGLEAMREPYAGARTLVIRTARAGPATFRVTVQDSGPGIALKDLGHIFNASPSTPSLWPDDRARVSPRPVTFTNGLRGTWIAGGSQPFARHDQDLGRKSQAVEG